jgi:hypothetical protein
MDSPSDAQLLNYARPHVESRLAGSKQIALSDLHVDSSEVNLVLSATARVPLFFSAWMGKSYSDIKVSATAPRRFPRKIDIRFFLDSSASMGLAATPAGRDKLSSLVGCAFACHEVEGGQTKSNLQVAQENGVLTRVDVLRNAVNAMIDKFVSQMDKGEQLRVSIDTFDDTLHNPVPLTSDMSRAKQALANYQLGYNTFYQDAGPLFAGGLGAQGNGNSAPFKYVIMVTDGVQGQRSRVGGFHPFDPAVCQGIKNRGITMIVLNTKYIPMPTSAPYIQTVAPIYDQLEPALRACASPGWYFSAVDQDEIMASFDHMMAAIRNDKVRLAK